jgi:hypothetical protein
MTPKNSDRLDRHASVVYALRRRREESAYRQGILVASQGLPATLCLEHDAGLRQEWLFGWREERDRIMRRWDEQLKRDEEELAG